MGSGVSWVNCCQDICFQMKFGIRYQDIPMETTKIRTKRKQCRVCQDDTDLDIFLGGKKIRLR